MKHWQVVCEYALLGNGGTSVWLRRLTLQTSGQREQRMVPAHQWCARTICNALNFAAGWHLSEVCHHMRQPPTALLQLAGRHRWRLQHGLALGLRKGYLCNIVRMVQCCTPECVNGCSYACSRRVIARLAYTRVVRDYEAICARLHHLCCSAMPSAPIRSLPVLSRPSLSRRPT